MKRCGCCNADNDKTPNNNDAASWGKRLVDCAGSQHSTAWMTRRMTRRMEWRATAPLVPIVHVIVHDAQIIAATFTAAAAATATATAPLGALRGATAKLGTGGREFLLLAFALLLLAFALLLALALLLAALELAL